MRIPILLLAVVLLWVAPVRGQEALVQDFDPEPFSGQLVYRLTYSGAEADSWASYAADSMQITVTDSFVVYRSWGGRADSLLSEVCWRVADSSFFTVDHRHQRAYRLTNSDPQLYTVVSGEQDGEGLGHPLTRYVLSTPDGEKSTVWVAEAIRFAAVPPLARDLYQIPLRSVRSYNGIQVQSELVAVRVLPPTVPGLPANYEIVDFDARPIRHPALQQD